MPGKSAVGQPFAIILLSSLTLAACTGHDNDPTEKAQTSETPRIVSFSPAISRTLVDLGLANRLVGRTRFCFAVDPAIPVVGDLTSVNYETLIRVQPTHILLQPAGTGTDPALGQLARSRGWAVGLWPRLNGVKDIERLLQELPGLLYPEPSDASDEVRQRAQGTLNAIAASLNHTEHTLFRGRTLVLSSLEPMMAFGRGTYMDDILTRLGASNATRAKGWVQLSLEDVVRLNPQAIVLVLDVDPTVAPEPTETLRPIRDLHVDATRDGRLAVLANPDALLPSSGVVAVANSLRAVLHEFSETRG